MTQERRRFTRVPFEGELILEHDGRPFDATLLDISLKGLLVVIPPGWTAQTDDFCHAAIVLSPELTIHLDTQIVYQGDDRAGLRIERTDMDGLTHLRRLLELNLGDTTLLERELSALGG